VPPPRSSARRAIRVDDGAVTTRAPATTPLAVTTDAILKREATAKAKPKAAQDRKVIGKSEPRRDIPAKVTGGVAYVQDLRLPEMVFGRAVRPPSPRAKLQSVDEGFVREMPGVVAIVRDGSFLGVAAEREEQAIAAAKALSEKSRWEEKGDLPPSGRALFESMLRAKSQDSVVSEKINADAAAKAVKRLDASYTRPFQAHASIGPSCAVAQWRDGKLTVWSHSQGVFPLRGDLAKALRVAPDDIVVIHREGSGCYGQNGADDVALDAALVARATHGRPVKLQWMREDEFAWEPYGSAMTIHRAAGLDASGNIVDWQHELWSHTHSMRPGDPEGCNLLASWYAESPLLTGTGAQHSAAFGWRRSQRRAVLRLSAAEDRQSFAAAKCRFVCRRSHARSLWQRVRRGVVHRRGGRRGRRPGRVPIAPSHGSARQGGDRGVAAKPAWKPNERQRTAAAGHRLREVQESGRLLRGGRRSECRPGEWCRAGASHLGSRRRRHDRESGRACEPDRRRLHPIDELDIA
jgi:hypothetical protein